MSTAATGQAPNAAPQPQLDPNLTDPAALQAMLYQGAPVVLQGQEPPPAAQPTPPSAEPAGSVEPPAQPEPPTAPEPPAGSTPPADPTEERILPNRISTQQFEPEAQRAMALQHTLNNGKKPGDAGFVTLAQALQQVQAADNPAPSSEAPVAPQPTQLETLTATVQSAETKLAELRQRRSEMAAEGTLYGDELDSINRQIEDEIQSLAEHKADLKHIQRETEQTEAQRQQAEHQRAVKDRSDAKAEALKQYPTAGDESLPLGREVKALVQELNQPGNPDASILTAKNAATIVCERAAVRLAQRTAAEKGTTFAEEFGKLIATTQAAPAAPAAPATPEPQRVLPGVGRQQPQAAVPQKTAAQILAEVGTDPVKIREAQAAMNQGRGGSIFMIR